MRRKGWYDYRLLDIDNSHSAIPPFAGGGIRSTPPQERLDVIGGYPPAYPLPIGAPPRYPAEYHQRIRGQEE
jgi:hypothetical protein